MKYLIVKGWLGFGDRLESLKMAVKYALTYNLQIYVDWRDPMWSHGTEDFYTYFKLVNMPILNSLDDLPEDATYYPSFWKGNLDKHISYDFVQEHKDAKIDIGLLDKPFDADVIVFSSCGNRFLYPDSTFFGNVFRVVDSRILTSVKHHFKSYPISTSWGIHVRGTDRVKDKKRLFSIQAIVSNITTMGGMNKSNMVVVSDDKEQADILKRYYPSSYIVSKFDVDNRKGIHNLNHQELNISKDQLNVEMLIDFFVLTKCERVFTTVKDSRFAKEAMRLHSVIDTILSL
jgi:hypothetical protein